MLTLLPGQDLKIVESVFPISIKKFCLKQEIYPRVAQKDENPEILSNLYYNQFLLPGAQIIDGQYNGFDIFWEDFQRDLLLLIYGEMIDYHYFSDWCESCGLEKNKQSLIDFLLKKRVTALQIQLIQRCYCQTITAPIVSMVKFGIFEASNQQISIDEQKTCFLIFNEKNTVKCETRTALSVINLEANIEIPGIISTQTRFTKKGPRLRQIAISNSVLEEFVRGIFPKTIKKLQKKIYAQNYNKKETDRRYQQAFQNTKELLSRLNPRLVEQLPHNFGTLWIVTESDIPSIIFKVDAREFLYFPPGLLGIFNREIRNICEAYNAWVINPLCMQQFAKLKEHINQLQRILLEEGRLSKFFSRYFVQADLLFARVVNVIYRDEIINAAIEEQEKTYLPKLGSVHDQPELPVNPAELEKESQKVLKIEKLKLACGSEYINPINLILVDLKKVLDSDMTAIEKLEQFTENCRKFSAEYFKAFKDSEEMWKSVLTNNFFAFSDSPILSEKLSLLLPIYLRFSQTNYHLLVDDYNMGNHAVIQKFLQSIFGNPIELSWNIKNNEEKLTKALEEHQKNLTVIAELKLKLQNYRLIGEDPVTVEKRNAVSVLLQKLDDPKLTSKERLSHFQTALNAQEKVFWKIRDHQGNCPFDIFQPITHASKFLLNKFGFFTVRGQRVTQELNAVLSIVKSP